MYVAIESIIFVSFVVKYRLLAYITRVVLFVVYVSFFIVQCFFVANNNYQSSLPLVSKAKTPVRLKQYHPASAKKDGKRATVRLNKRFQPQAMLFHCGTDILVPCSYITAPVSSTPTGYLLISSILVDSLRGPPAIG